VSAASWETVFPGALAEEVGMFQGRRSNGEELRTGALAQALRDVDEIQERTGRAVRAEIARRAHAGDLESRDRTRERWWTRSLFRDYAIIKRRHADRFLGGIRGKFHPSKKGLGKTVSAHAVRRLRDHG
jgi:hypothetical protein